MMPFYDYKCGRCGSIRTLLRRIDDRASPAACWCGKSMERLVAAPALGIWNAERKFPNLSPYGDGTMTFPSKAAYEARLKELNFAEVSQGGLVKRPHGNKVVRTITHGARRKGAAHGR